MKKENLTKGMCFMTPDGNLEICGFNGTHLTVFYERYDESGEMDYGYLLMTISDLERRLYEYSGVVRKFVYGGERSCI